MVDLPSSPLTSAVSGGGDADGDGTSAAITYCTYCASSKSHPVFVFLIALSEEGQEEFKTRSRAGGTTHIGRSCNPNERIKEINQRKDPRTAYGAPYWELEMVIGPFVRGAKRFKEQWQRQSRKTANRLVKGVAIARAHDGPLRLAVCVRDVAYLRTLLATNGNDNGSSGGGGGGSGIKGHKRSTRTKDAKQSQQTENKEKRRRQIIYDDEEEERPR